MINQEVKGTLARLLATENLTVEHRQVTTAYFDVEQRILCLPIWKHASDTVYDLLVGHEVGHALYTPAEGLDTDRNLKSFINVLEDARDNGKTLYLHCKAGADRSGLVSTLVQMLCLGNGISRNYYQVF